MVQQQEIVFRLSLYRALCVSCPSQCALLCVSLLCSLMASSGLRCNFCPLQPKGLRCPNVTTECRPQERCYSARVLFGQLHILSAQGCVPRERCSTVQSTLFRAVSCSLNYTCCCRDRCNQPPERDDTLKVLLGKTLSSHEGGVTMNATADDCPEDNSSQENTKAKVGLGLKVLSAFK